MLQAATDEFAAYGIAGARVDRIGTAANANKALIYAHFGNKDQLFDAVIEHAVTQVMTEVPLTPFDLADYAGRLFDFLVSHPQHLRLATWHRLEREGSGHDPVGMRSSMDQKAAAIAAAQAAAEVPSDFSAEDLLAFTLALAAAWMPLSSTVPITLDEHSLVAHRAAVVEAVRRLASAPT